MIDLLGTIFINPMVFSRREGLLLLLPLCLAVSIVYKTTKCDDVRTIPLAALVSWVTILLGMFAVGIGVLLLYTLAA